MFIFCNKLFLQYVKYKIFVLKQSLKEIHSFAPSFNLRRATHQPKTQVWVPLHLYHFFSSMLPNEMAIYPNWLILYINKIVVPVVLLVIVALTILMKYGRDLQREFWTQFKISNCFNITRKTNIVCVSNLYMQAQSPS